MIHHFPLFLTLCSILSISATPTDAAPPSSYPTGVVPKGIAVEIASSLNTGPAYITVTVDRTVSVTREPVTVTLAQEPVTVTRVSTPATSIAQRSRPAGVEYRAWEPTTPADEYKDERMLQRMVSLYLQVAWAAKSKDPC